MASELKPCPFCGKAMMLRGALWPSEGDTDAVIHAEPTECPMYDFCDGTADGSIVERWNTRPAPAATDTGLVTVAWRFRDLWEGGHKYWKFTERRYDLEETEFRALCDRSQADELLAAEIRRERDLAAKQLSEVVDRMSDDYLALKADNAAKDARIKELEELLAKFADKGTLQALKDANDRSEALEAKLAAAQEAHKSLFGDKTMEDILWPDVKPTDLITIRVQKQIYDKARAVLGGKPS